MGHNDSDNPILSAPRTGGPCASGVTRTLLEHVEQIAASCGATVVLLCVDPTEYDCSCLSEPLRQKVWYVAKKIPNGLDDSAETTRFLRVPNVPLTRMGQVKIAIFLALSKGLVKRGDRIVSLSGMADSGTLDTIIVTEVGREYEMFAASEAHQETPPHILPEVVERVVDIASQLGKEGREGKPVGALFVVGDAERVIGLTRQLILNPFRGYPEHERNLLDHSLEETIKELAALDGAFVVRGDGVVETCGAYLKTAGPVDFELPRGLGTRHHAAAAITAVTDSIAVTVSESTGTVTIFRGGSIIVEIEKPRTIGARLRSRTPKPGKTRRPPGKAVWPD